jgi:hypothetical protein
MVDLPRVSRGAWGARLASAVLAVALSGALRLAPAAAHPGHAGSHQCRCGARDAAHDCACPSCHAARSRRPGASPSCHRRAAKGSVAVAREGGGDLDGDRPGDRSAPCVTGTCGLPEAPAAAHGGPADSFLVPDAPLLAHAEWSTAVTAAGLLPCDAPHPPDTPPPRAG